MKKKKSKIIKMTLEEFMSKLVFDKRFANRVLKGLEIKNNSK